MLKMIRLDWSAMKQYHLRSLLLPVGMFIVGCSNPIFLMPMGTFLAFSYFLNIFGVEEKGDLNCLYLTLPVERRRIVSGRYFFSLILFLGGIVLGRLLMPLTNLISLSKWYPSASWNFEMAAVSFLLYALMNLSMYPLLFRFGYQKGKFLGMYVPLCLFGLIYTFIAIYTTVNGSFLSNMLVYASNHIALVIGGTSLAAAGILAVSWLLSVRFYSRREF